MSGVLARIVALVKREPSALTGLAVRLAAIPSGKAVPSSEPVNAG